MGAAAIISLLDAILPSAIQGAQKLFGSVSGAAKAANDTAKLNTVLSTVTPFLQALATAGKTPGSIIPADVETAIEAVLAALKQVGSIPTNSATAVTGSSPATAVKIAGTLTIGG